MVGSRLPRRRAESEPKVYEANGTHKEEEVGGVRWSKTEQGQSEEDNGHTEMWLILVWVEKHPL